MPRTDVPISIGSLFMDRGHFPTCPYPDPLAAEVMGDIMAGCVQAMERVGKLRATIRAVKINPHVHSRSRTGIGEYHVDLIFDIRLSKDLESYSEKEEDNLHGTGTISLHPEDLAGLSIRDQVSKRIAQTLRQTAHEYAEMHSREMQSWLNMLGGA